MHNLIIYYAYDLKDTVLKLSSQESLMMQTWDMFLKRKKIKTEYLSFQKLDCHCTQKVGNLAYMY